MSASPIELADTETRQVTHPGEVLRERFLAPLRISPTALSVALGVPSPRITELVRGRRGVTLDTALRLARYFDTAPQFWLNLQVEYDCAQVVATERERIAREVPVCARLERLDPVTGGEADRFAPRTLDWFTYDELKRKERVLRDVARWSGSVNLQKRAADKRLATEPVDLQIVSFELADGEVVHLDRTDD